MEFTVITSSQLQPNLLACGTVEGDLYILDAFKPSCNRIRQEDKVTTDISYISDAKHHSLVELLIKRHRIFKSGIVALEYHPRLPSVLAVGLNDGTLQVLFLEPENPELKKNVFLHKFDHRVDQIQWLLMDRGSDPEPSRQNSMSFGDRIWNRISKTPYVSLIIARSGSVITWMPLEKRAKCHRLNVGTNPQGVVYRTDEYIESQSNVEPSDQMVSMTQQQSLIICTVKWPLPGYFSEELEHESLTNFCIVQEALCVVHSSEGIYLEIYIPEYYDDSIEFVRFHTRIDTNATGVPSAVHISPKQYNQMNRYLETGSPHMFTLQGDRCINALSEFMAIATMDGAVYVTSMLHIYNQVRSVYYPRITSTPSGVSTEVLEPHDIVAIVHMDSFQLDQPVRSLMWTLIWNDYTQPPTMLRPDECCCTSDVAFLLSALCHDGIRVLKLYSSNCALALKVRHMVHAQARAMHWVEDTLPGDIKLIWATENSISRKSFG
ncbi:uncharacterized protein BBOV_IV007000 [Babesia bovis T2Bo]|uniref:Cleavage/polyadenylation specificity factor A subunit N-terminal domain-containing protein n=1 Tax=Babesia bovis TaxID=5865 RepID=A7AR87_BABBO|nr:uncharacterized protein BBOV_IV007000 [Babesia bovis T2Bo]EDO07056.1 hypothetical protein BBOV_IV007000 [Babesia bovis T2Bo]|eukprot:XP_001610624.1 hypothetical protein [Babesia bovis T2Bo]